VVTNTPVAPVGEGRRTIGEIVASRDSSPRDDSASAYVQAASDRSKRNGRMELRPCLTGRGGREKCQTDKKKIDGSFRAGNFGG
jgi:hypothetical protein